jgi:hypothetical protein
MSVRNVQKTTKMARALRSAALASEDFCLCGQPELDAVRNRAASLLPFLVGK